MSLQPHSPQNWKRPNFTEKKFGFRKRKPHFLHREGRHRFRLKKLLGVFITLGLFAGVVGVGAVIASVAFFSRELPDPGQLVDRQSVESSKIYDRTGKTVLYEIHGDIKRNYIQMSDLPEYIPQATIAIEDKDFYFHRGVNFKSVLKAVYEKLTRGGQLRGASTITQQLVKNAILSPERTITRKFKEWILALQIERQYEKDQILELYLNEIPYGSVVYGIEAASQTFLGKSAKDLTLAQTAVLVAIPQAPTYYSPFGTNIDALFTRQKLILDRMVLQGYITEEEADFAKKEEIHFTIKKEGITAPHFVMYIREQLAEKHGEQILEEGGLKIITTLDLDKQKFAEEAVAQYAETNKTNWNANNASLVSIDPKTGQILAMVGSTDFFDTTNDGQVNVALRPRQPGSSFKPIVYTTAFTRGYTSETVVFDVNTNFKDVCSGTPNYEPKNYNLSENGAVTFRKALQGSLNIPAVKALYLTGVSNVIELAKKMGYTTFDGQENRFCLSLVLGGGEVKLLDHVGAFSIFAQEGIKHDIASVLEVTDKNGNKIDEYKDQSERVLETDIARITNDVLSDNDARSFIFGTNSKLTIPGREVAAKTGTTNDYHDAWTVGYTPSLATGVWVGNTRNEEMKRGSDGSVLAAPIWNAYMTKALNGMPVERFSDMPALGTEKPALTGKTLQEVTVKIDKQSGKLATEYTPPRNIEEKIYHPMHSILYYVKKDDPRGEAPGFPNPDQQYPHWEEAIRTWASKQNVTPDFPPTEYDDIHTAQDKPSLKILSPSENETITDRNFEVDIKADAPRDIEEAEYYIDDVRLTSVKSSPFDLTHFTLGDEVRNGFHTLRVFVYDDLNNFEVKEINLNFLLESLPPDFSWKNIGDSISIKSESFPYSFKGTINNVNSVKKIQIKYREKNSAKQHIIAQTDNPADSTYSFTWEKSPGSGNYEMFALLTDTEGKEFTGESVDVDISSDSNGILDGIFNRR